MKSYIGPLESRRAVIDTQKLPAFDWTDLHMLRELCRGRPVLYDAVCHYSSTHGSALNKQYTSEATAIVKGNPYPIFAGCAIWDILTATYRALAAQGGTWDHDKELAFPTCEHRIRYLSDG